MSKQVVIIMLIVLGLGWFKIGQAASLSAQVAKKDYRVGEEINIVRHKDLIGLESC